MIVSGHGLYQELYDQNKSDGSETIDKEYDQELSNLLLRMVGKYGVDYIVKKIIALKSKYNQMDLSESLGYMSSNLAELADVNA